MTPVGFNGWESSTAISVAAYFANLDSGIASAPDIGVRQRGEVLAINLDKEEQRMSEHTEPIDREPMTRAQIQAVTVGELTPLAGPVQIVEYDPAWPALFERGADRIHSILNRVRLGIWVVSLIAMLLFSGSVGAGASSPASPRVIRRASLLLCTGTTRVSARLMRDDLRVLRSRVREAFGAQSKRVAPVGPRCIRVAIPRTQTAIVRQVIQPGDVALADSGSHHLNPGTKVRLKCQTGVCPAGFTLGTTPRRGHAYPVLRVVVPGSMVVRGSAVLGRQGNSWTVTYTLTRQGNRLWCSYTGSHVQQFAAIVLDGTILVDPVVMEAICSAQSKVTVGGYAAAHRLGMYLNSGPLLVPLHLRR